MAGSALTPGVDEEACVDVPRVRLRAGVKSTGLKSAPGVLANGRMHGGGELRAISHVWNLQGTPTLPNDLSAQRQDILLRRARKSIYPI